MTDEIAPIGGPTQPTAEYGTSTGTTGPRIKSESYDVPGMALSRKHWNRLKEEADEAKMGWTELWLGAAFAFFGIAAAAAIARIAIPMDDPGAKTHLSAEARHFLAAIALAALVGGAVCFLAWLGKRKDHNAKLDQLIKNMKSHEHDQESPVSS